MKFEKVNSEANHECHKLGKEDTSNLFSRRIAGDTNEYIEFNSYFKLGKSLSKEKREIPKCRCMFSSTSIDLINEKKIENILSHYKLIKEFSPKLIEKNPFFVKFYIKTGGGHVFETSNSSNPFHHSFLKSDDFNIQNHINVIGIEKI